ncbi:MAG: NADH-quinone oxidoreductase subunit NuoG [Gammaproteobacteria bacterium]|nr:NADH-quinone oxidoreductase subunit NuoG [Gammaproteobacteria bacterium]
MTDIDIEIDGKTLKAQPGQMVIQVADAAGIYIPRFCYHKHLSVAANCRMCLVEVEKVPKALPACATPVAPGMKIFTRSKAALAAQKAVMEFLLINHPLDCPICDQGGECELQDLSLGFGPADSFYTERKRSVKDKDIGPLISTEMTRCIHCTRCVRFGDEIAGMRELGATGRGENMEIGTYIEEAVESELSGNVIDLCPVGALTSKPFRFKARAWELKQYPSIAPHDCLGSNIYVHTYQDKVMRVVPRENANMNETWISDRDRFSYEGLNHPDRLQRPMIRTEKGWIESDWQTAFDAVVQLLQNILNQEGGDQLAALASPNSTLEEFYLLQKLFRSLKSPHIDFRLHEKDFSDQNHLPIFPGIDFSLADIENQDVIILIGSQIRQEQPLLSVRIRKAIKKGAQVIVINPASFQFNFDVAVEKIIPNLAHLEIDKEIEKYLQPGKKICIFVGGLAMHHPHAAVIRARAHAIADQCGAKIGILTFGANAAGGWLSGAIPHRGPYGEKLSEHGLDAQAILKNQRKGYVLLNVEPEDCGDPAAFNHALRHAQTVIALSCFKHPVLLETADVILPVTPFTETSGTFVNVTGEWQSFTGVTQPLGEARPAWKVLRVLANVLGCEGFEYASSAEVRDELSQLKKPFTAEPLSQKHSQDGHENSEVLPHVDAMYQSDNIVRRAKALQERSS